jgi:hypothetical protein
MHPDFALEPSSGAFFWAFQPPLSCLVLAPTGSCWTAAKALNDRSLVVSLRHLVRGDAVCRAKLSQKGRSQFG